MKYKVHGTKYEVQETKYEVQNTKYEVQRNRVRSEEGDVAVAEVTVLPVGTKSPSLSRHVAEAIKPLEKSGLKYELGSMGTSIEGSLEEIVKVIMEMHETPFKAGFQRVLTTIVIDDRRDKEISMNGKKKSVMEKK